MHRVLGLGRVLCSPAWLRLAWSPPARLRLATQVKSSDDFFEPPGYERLAYLDAHLISHEP